ncbi:hypothetical protein QTG54_001209 [Skeletonema marinoi]|uniref:Uncharacterized protein n=1 Tax=Skeletonema marinoi TaxID=267567 RepID=A0AAD8YQ68_9STRA|nr:hypothetical protein QTG54_001209 [Skeletonema marinoi]
MLKVSRGDAGPRSPMEGTMSAQRRRNRRAAAASDSLASLMMLPSDNTNNLAVPSSSSSSARKKQSKHHHHHHHRSTPSSLEQIANTAAATSIISAEDEKSTAAVAPSTGKSKKSTSSKTKQSGKRSHLSMTTSLSSLAIISSADKQQSGSSNKSNAASPQKKSHKKKRQMSPRSKSKLDSLQQQPQQLEENVEDKGKDKAQQQRLQHLKDAEPIVKGSLVIVQPRTWPGMNKLGGVGRVVAVHSSTSYDLDSSSQQMQQNSTEEGESSNNIIDASTTTTYDVSYVLGGKDKNIEAEYVLLHDTNQEAPRERHQRSSVSKSEPEKDSVKDSKTKSVKKKRKKIASTVTTEASPPAKKESLKKGNITKISSTARGKQLRQLKQVRDQHVAAAEEEDGSTTNNLSPAFSLSSQFSKQDGTFSPLDYLADSYPKIDTPVLDTYSEKWSNNDEPQQLEQQQQQQNSEEEEEDDEDRDDDPSSSVVSTDEDGSGFTPPRQQRKRASPVKYSNSEMMKGDMSPPSENKNLEREYGRLALKKQEIERKMKIYKSDAEKINPWATTTAGRSNVDTSGSSLLAQSPPGRSDTVGRSETVGRRSHRGDNDGNEYPITRYSAGVPSREEVEFGELVYQRNLTDRRMAELKDGYPKRSKPKKKRRRRVVETITRVIHEESEDDGSSISDRHRQLKSGRYDRDYYESPDRRYTSQNPMHSRRSFDRRRSGSSDSEFRDQDYARQHSSQRNQTQGLESRKRRYPEQSASSGSRKTKSRPSSMLEDLD